MSYFSNIDYRIFKSAGGSFDDMVEDILRKIDVEGRILRVVFFAAVDGNDDYSGKLSCLRDGMVAFTGGELPALSLVPQKPLDAGLVAEVHSYRPGDGETVVYGAFEGFPYAVVQTPYAEFLYTGGLHSSLLRDISSQSTDTLRLLNGILQREGFPVESIVRQWNYIGSITTFDVAGNQHYQMFNNVRSVFYSSAEWTDGYPAATGIGTLGRSVVVDADAVVTRCSDLKIRPIDNKLQIAAHAYSKDVLENADTGLTTPKFERAKSLDMDGERLVYVSGTAAIRGEKSIDGNVLKQLQLTMENIRQLTGIVPIRLLRIYLKNEDDYEDVYRVLSAYPDIEQSYLLADVCRDELLIEIEGVAVGCS